jgi:hypothetical protein
MKHQIGRQIMWLLAMALLALASAGPGFIATASAPVTVNSGLVTVLPGSPIEIAVAIMYDYATAQDLFDAVTMALADYRDIKGFDVQDNHFDAGCDEPTGQSAADSIVANAQHAGVIGPFCSASTHGAAPIFEANGIVMISPFNTIPDLSGLGPNIFNRVVEEPYFEDWDAAINALPSVQDWQDEVLILLQSDRGESGNQYFPTDGSTKLAKASIPPDILRTFSQPLRSSQAVTSALRTP